MKNQNQEFMFRQQIPDSDRNSQYKTLTFQVHFKYSEVPSSMQIHGGITPWWNVGVELNVLHPVVQIHPVVL